MLGKKFLMNISYSQLRGNALIGVQIPQILAEYRERVRDCHPDTAEGDPHEACERFMKLQEAKVFCEVIINSSAFFHSKCDTLFT